MILSGLIRSRLFKSLGKPPDIVVGALLFQQLSKISGRQSLRHLTLLQTTAPGPYLQLIILRLTSLPVEETTKISRTPNHLPNVPDALTPFPGRASLLLLLLVALSLTPAPATVSTPPVPPLIKVEELDIFNQTIRPSSTQLSKHHSDDSPDLLKEKHVPVLQRFYHSVIGEPTGGFADTSTNLACQLWDLMEAHCAQREYTRCTVPASWVDLGRPPVRRDKDDPSHGSTGL